MLARVRDVTVRLTVGEALVRWLQSQYSARDGERRRAIPALWGIFGHGNALGLGGALPHDGLPLYTPRHEQAMVHAAIGTRRRRDEHRRSPAPPRSARAPRTC